MSGQLTEVAYEKTGLGYKPSASIPVEQELVPEISQSAYEARLDEINDSFRFLHDGQGNQLEVAIVNQDKLGGNVVLFPSTSFSSLTHNPGNAMELAMKGAANPNTAYIYVAFPGNGGSSSFSRAEQKYRRKTGRFTEWDTDLVSHEPLPTIKAAARILTKKSLVPNHMSGDESGGRLGISLMAAFDRNSIKDAYFNGIPGVSARVSYEKEMLAEDIKSRARRRGLSEAMPWEITPQNKKAAKARMPRIYGPLGQRALVTSTYIRGALYNAPVNMRAFRGHADLESPGDHAAIWDTLAALDRQEAVISFQFNQASPIHGKEDCIKFGQIIMNAIPVDMYSEQRGVKIIFGEGGLDAHTDEPQERLRAERHALSSIVRFLVGIQRPKLLNKSSSSKNRGLLHIRLLQLSKPRQSLELPCRLFLPRLGRYNR